MRGGIWNRFRFVPATRGTGARQPSMRRRPTQSNKRLAVREQSGAERVGWFHRHRPRLCIYDDRGVARARALAPPLTSPPAADALREDGALVDAPKATQDAAAVKRRCGSPAAVRSATTSARDRGHTENCRGRANHSLAAHDSGAPHAGACVPGGPPASRR